MRTKGSKPEDARRLSYFNCLQLLFHSSSTRIDITAVTLKKLYQIDEHQLGWDVRPTSRKSFNSFRRTPPLLLVSWTYSLESIAIFANVAAFMNEAKALLRSPLASCSFAERICARAVLIKVTAEAPRASLLTASFAFCLMSATGVLSKKRSL